MLKKITMSAIAFFMFCSQTTSVLAYDTKKIKVIDDGVAEYYITNSATVQELFTEKAIRLSSKDLASKSLHDSIEDLETIVIERGTPIIINIDGVPRMITTTKETVGDISSEITNIIDGNYIFENVSKTTKISENMIINVLTLKEVSEVTYETIPYETIVTDNHKMEVGTENVIKSGSNGTIEITVTNMYNGDELVSSNETSRKVVTEAVNTVIEKGTKVPVVAPPVVEVPVVAPPVVMPEIVVVPPVEEVVEEIVETVIVNEDGEEVVETKVVETVVSSSPTVEVDGVSYAYNKSLSVVATGYTPYDPGCNGITATGVAAKRGIIAVDTSVIPFGTKIYIPGYGVGIAADRGGAIKGNKIDLCYDTVKEALSWGRRTVTIFILE